MSKWIQKLSTTIFKNAMSELNIAIFFHDARTSSVFLPTKYNISIDEIGSIIFESEDVFSAINIKYNDYIFEKTEGNLVSIKISDSLSIAIIGCTEDEVKQLLEDNNEEIVEVKNEPKISYKEAFTSMDSFNNAISYDINKINFVSQTIMQDHEFIRFNMDLFDKEHIVKIKDKNFYLIAKNLKQFGHADSNKVEYRSFGGNFKFNIYSPSHDNMTLQTYFDSFKNRISIKYTDNISINLEKVDIDYFKGILNHSNNLADIRAQDRACEVDVMGDGASENIDNMYEY